MFRKLIAIAGIILLLISLNLYFKLTRIEKLAESYDSENESFGFVEGPLSCKWEVNTPERVMNESKSQSILVKVTNSTGEECQSNIALRSPGFDISPLKEEQSITLKKDGQGSLSWIITPKKSGSYEISVSDALNSKIFGITVTNIFGLNALQAKIASIFGGLFGPMFTIPWWWEKLRQKKQIKQEKQIESKPNSS